MNEWKTLYARFSDIQSQRADQERKAREAADAFAAFEAWCNDTTEQVMQAVLKVSLWRASEFEQSTGFPVKVAYPSRPAVQLGADGPFMTFLRLTLADLHVDIYTHRAAGSLPYLHLLQTTGRRWVGGAKQRPQTVASLTGCYVARLPDHRWELRRIHVPGVAAPPAEPITVEELAYRAFELLVTVPRS